MLHKFLHSLGLVPPVELDLNEQKHIIMEEYERGWAVRAAQVSIFFIGQKIGRRFPVR